jgi:hypothetical protein
MKKLLPSVLLALLLGGSVTLLQSQNTTGKETVIPAGNSGKGKTLFVEKGCYLCHSAAKTKFPAVDLEPRLVIELGGDIHAGWTRDDYAKSIMNPNHIVSEDYRIAMIRLGDHFKAENSPMPQFTELLTVSDLIQITTFLDELTE